VQWIICPGCGLNLPSVDGPTDPQVNASAECRSLIYDLSFYTLERRYTFFIHQVAVDAYGAQHYKEGAPTIGLAFALIGLCLLLEHAYTGKEVQDAHIRLAQKNKDWPLFTVPEKRGMLTVADALASSPGNERDAAIIRWASSVWDAYKHEKESVEVLLKQYGEIQ
jgi:hypothetical protein